MAKIDFKIGSKYKHLIADEKEALKECQRIWNEFNTNIKLYALLHSYGKTQKAIEDSDIGSKVKVSEEAYDSLKKNWQSILCFFALMDNPNSPFQVFKADYQEKVNCVIDCLSLNKEAIRLLGFSIAHTSEQRELDLIHNGLLSIRFAYSAIVSSTEWQNILDLAKFIYDSRKIWLESDSGGDSKDRIRNQTDKFSLNENIQKGVERLQELLARYYGGNTPIAKDAENFISVKTAFREYARTDGDFVDIGQGKNW